MPPNRRLAVSRPESPHPARTAPGPGRFAPRRRAAAVAALLVLGGLTVSITGEAAPAPRAGRVIDLGGLPRRSGPAVTGISLESTSGEPEDAIGGASPTVSGNGRIVAFVGPRRVSVDGDPVGDTAYLRDRATSTLVDLLPLGVGRRPGATASAVVSSDGCSITVVTQIALDLFDDDDQGERWDVYRAAVPRCRPRDLVSSVVGDASSLEWELVSADGDGRARDDVDPAERPAVSATGTVVAFVVPDAPRSPRRRVLVTDLTVPTATDGRTVAAPGLPVAAPDDGSSPVGQVQPAVSGDGEVVAFASDADAAAAEPVWTTSRRDPTATDVYVWHRATGTVESVTAHPDTSRAAPGRRVPAADARRPSLSFDGSVVAFEAVDRDEGRRDVGSVVQVVVRRADGDADGVADDPVVRLVSHRHDARSRPANGPSSQPSVSADGSVVAFLTRATDILPTRVRPGRIATDGDVVVADLSQRVLRRAALRPDAATAVTAAHGAPALSANGRVVVFDTAMAAAMVPGAPRTRDRQVVAASFPTDLSMPVLDAGTTLPNRPSPEWFVTVSNAGPSSFSPRVVQASDPRFVVTGGTCIGAVVPSGGSCRVQIVFTPTGPGDVEADLRVAETGFRAAEVTTVLLGSGGEPTLAATPAGIALPPTAVGQVSSSVSIEVRNIGWWPTTVATVALGGEHPDDMRVTSETCVGVELAPDQGCTVEVAFAPTTAGSLAALVDIVTSTGSRTSALVGGVATYAPGMVTVPDIRAGRPIDLLGWGYPPRTMLVVSWADGLGRSASVETDARGEFVARLPIHVRERPGRRTLVVSDPAGGLPTVSSPVLVRPGR